MGIIIGIVVVFLLLFCCIVPFIRSMLASAAAKQMINVSVRPTGIDIGCTTCIQWDLNWMNWMNLCKTFLTEW